MQDNKTNRDKLYTFLTNKGVTGIGANRDEFETIFEDEEKQKKLYDFCVSKGYTGIGKDYDEFAGGFSVQQTAPEQNAFEGLKGMAESQGVTMPVDSTLPTENRNQDIFAGREAMARYADSAQNLRKAQAAYNMSPTAENAEQLDSAAMDFSNVETSRLDAEKEKRTKEELLAERKRLEDAKREAELRLRTRRGEITSPSGMYQMGMAPVTGNQAAEITDPEMTKLYAAVNSYDNAIRSVDRKLSGEEPGFWEGVADATVRNPGFYTMGLTDMSDARGMLNIAQNGVKEKEDELLADALYSKNAEQQDEDFGFLYRAGNMFGHSVPFMVQTAVTGGFSGASRAGANLAGRLGKKAAEGTIKKKIINAMGTTIDDVIEAGLIANTAGAGGTWANIADRKAGKINIKDGNYIFENGESWLGALYKGEVSSILELYTEKLGGHLEGKLSLTKGLDKIGASRVSNVLLAAKNSDLYKGASTVMRQFGLNGYLPEVLEEEANLVLNSLLVGDNSLSELYNPKTQLDIFGGMLLTVGTMQAIPGTIATAGYVKNQYQMNRADSRAADVFGEDWGAIKEALDNATNEKVAGIVAENLRDNVNQNEALLDYYKRMMIMRGYNIGTVKNETAPEIEEAYTDGFSQEPTGTNALNAMTGYEMARQEVARALGLAEGDDVDVFLNGRTAEDIAKGDTDVENAVKNYQQQKARMEGIQERFQQTREQQYEESDRSIQANDNNGMVYATQLKDEPVFITGGNVVLNEDGTIDVDNSSETLYVKFPDGHVEMTSPDKFTEVFTSDRTADLKAAKRAEIDAKWKAEFDTAEAQSVEQEKRDSGVVFDMTDAQGEHRIEILNEGEMMSDILLDGAQMEIPTEELNRWKQVAGIQSADAVELPDVPDFFRLNGTNYEVASRNDDGSVDVMVNGKRETLPAGTDYSTLMPTDKKGDIAFADMPVERTHEYFVQRVTNDKKRAEMIDNNRKKAEAERKKFDKEPDAGLDPDKWEEVNRKWEEGKKAAQAKVDYWNEVAKREAEITRSETREAVENIKPDVMEETADEFIANQLAGIKITPESFKRETGLSNAEQAQLVGVISNDGVSVERAAEIILENYESELAGMGFTGDVQDVRDIIISVLSQGNPRSYAKKGREAREAENMDQQRADAEAWAKGAFDMKLEELYLYEETVLPRIVREYEGFDENEYYSNLAENNGYDTTRESESIGRGGELLQGEQPVPAGGTPVVGQRNEGGAVSDDVQGGSQNGVAQEEVPVNEPVGNSEQLSSSEIPNNQSVAEGNAPGNGGVQEITNDERAENGGEIQETFFLEETLDNGDKKITGMNSRGEVATVTIERDGKVVSVDSYDEGALFEHTEYDGNGKATSVTRYDKQGNVVGTQVYEDGKAKTPMQKLADQVLAAEAEVNTNPTEAQKEAGNYKKGHVKIGPFNISIEQPKGSVRSGVDKDGKKWEVEMQNTYGYFRGTEGVDGDHIDVFLSNDIDGWNGRQVFVVDQRNADGSFDEHKVMLGFNDINDAETAYMSNYEEGWQGLGAITGVSIEEFEKWISSSHRKTKAFAEYKNVKTDEGQSTSADKDLRRKLVDRILDRTEEKRRIPLRERARELEAQVGVKANIIESLDEVKNREARERIAAGEAVAGWYSGGQVYLYMPNIKDKREIELTYVHEVVAHHGVKKLLGERFNEFLDGVWKMMSEADRARMLAYVGANENPTLQDMRAAADEYVAELAEKMNLGELEQSTWDKIVDWFKELLENIGFENLTKEDIESMLKASYSNLRAESGKGKTGSAENDFRARMTFHGSGAQFDRFDHAFMGTGEGAQAFGWGTYVTDVEGIGRTYATTMRDKLISEKHKENAIINKLAKQTLESSNGNKEGALDYLRGLLNESWSDKKRVKAQIKIIETGKFLPETKLKANLYTVEIPDDNGSNYLHWDKPINGEIQERIANGLQSIGFEIEPGMNHLAYSRDGKIAVLNINAKGKDLYAELSEVLGGDKQASLFLSDMGFVGISYPANATTGGRADGARNYVIFNENDAEIKDRTMFRKKDSERRQEKRRINDAIDTAAGFITVGGKKQATKNRLKKEAERKQLAKEMYSSVLKGDFNDVTLSQIDKFIEDATPANPFGRRISQRLPQRMERALRQGARTNAVDALFGRISESAVPANERFSEAGRREIEERKKELLKGWAIATGNWHTDLKEFTDDTEPIGEGKDSKVYSSKDGRYVIKASKGKPYGKRFRPDIDNIALFNDVFRDTRYEILGYGEIDGEFVRILQQPIVDFAQSTPLTSEERREYMQSLGFEPLNDANTAFADGEIVIADLQKGNVVRDAAGNISVIDADAKLHTKDVGGDYTYPPVEEDLPEDSGTRFRIANENQEIFVSNAQRAVEGIQQNKATAEQWIAMLKKNGGLKAGEDAWLGLEEWLNEKQGAVTKQEILDYIGENKIQIEEVNYTQFGYGLIDEATRKLEAELKEIGWDAMVEKYPGFDELFEVYNGELLWSEERASVGEYEDFIIDDKIVDLDSQSNAINETREKYTTDGLERKREIALTVPTVEPYNESDEVHFGDAGNGRAVAWVRFGETTDSEGNRVLVIDEIQSKRHQDGREKGYLSNADKFLKDNGVEVVETDTHFEFYKNGEVDKRFAKGLFSSDIEKAKNLYVAGYEKTAVPSAPFEKNWHELAMKRMLRLAAEEGFDKVAWTTGEQQAERYNIGAVLKGLKAYKTSANEYYVIPYNNGAIGEFVKEYTEQELADTFGKELAQKIIANAENATEENPYEIEGEELRVGGEGMKGFYDRMLPSFVQKYTKKWGAKVGEVTMPGLRENNTMWSVDVTPEMQESVMQGQTMFRITDTDRQALEFKRQHKGSANIVAIDTDALVPELLAQGFTAEEIPEMREMHEKGVLGFYDRKRNTIYLLGKDHGEKENNATFWHENTHKAIGELDIPQEVMDEFYAIPSKRFIEFFEGKAKEFYGPEEYAEELIAYFVEDVQSNGNYDNVTKALGTSAENMERLKEIVEPIINYINHGRRTNEGTEGNNRTVVRETIGNGDVETLSEGARTDAEGAGETRFRTVEDVIEQQQENEVSLAKEAVTSLGEKLNTPVKIMDNLDSVPENRRKWKGWFDPKTGEVVVVMPNHVSTEDAVQTVLHEVVGHKGLRAVLGENFDGFLDGVYKNASPKVKRGINDRFLNALRNGPALTVREATEEYIAGLAERDFEGYRDTWNAIRQWFRNFFRNFMNMEITDGELRYLLWKNYNRMKNGPVEAILDRAMEANTGTGKVMARTAETYSAVDAYNKSVKGFKNKVKEGWYDEMRSLKKAQEAIEKELGREIMDSENVYLYANHIPSINKNKKEVFDNKYLRPFTSLLKQLYGKEVNGKKLDEKSLERYTNAKHGIERNREMSVKSALTEVQDGKKVFNDNAYKSWAQERDEVRGKNLPWAEEQRELDKVAEKYGAKIRDYSGLTAIFDTDKKLKYKKIADAAYQYVADVEKVLKDDVKTLWDLLKGMIDYSLNEAFESGMMSKATYEHIKQMYRYYVPLRGFTEQTAEDFFDYVEGDHSPLNAVVKTAYGRKSEADNIFATILNMANSAIVQGSKNRLKQRLLNLAMRSQTGLLNVDNAWYEKKGDTYEPVKYPEKANEYADFEERMKELEKNGEVVRHRPGLDIGWKVAETWNKTQHAVRVKRNGREYVVWVNGDPAMANAINGLLREEIGGAIKTVNQFRSKMVTQYSPTFVFTNLLRDVQSASIIYAVRRGTTMFRKFKNNVASNATDMMDLYLKHKRGTLDVNNPKERYFKEFLENGGETGYTEMISIEEYEKKLKELTTGLNIKNGTQRAFEAVGGAVDFANRCVENLSRFSAYQTSREAGISILKSIEDAKEVSVNFNRKGSGAMGQKWAKALYMFLNPAVQSIAQRILLTKKYPKKMAAVWAGEFILGAAMPVLYSIISAALGDDDDEITGNYYNLSDYRRRSSLCLPLKDGVFHIPLSHESRVLFGLGELCTSVVMGHEKPEDAPIEALNTLAQSLPLNPVEGWMPGKNIIETMTYNFMPDAAKPIAEAAMNRDFAGNTIHNRTDFNEFMPEYMRGKRGTSGVYKKISKYLTSTDGYEKSFLNDTFGAVLNPSVMEHLLEGYLGGLYTFGEKAFKAGAWAFGDEEYAEFRNIPIASSFYTSLAKYEDKPKEERTRRDWENAFRFYKDEVKNYDDKEKTAKNGLKHGEEGADLVLEQMERNGEVLMVDIFNDGNDRLKELYGASDAARKNRDFKRVEDIDQQIYAEKRNIVSQMEQLADDPMIGYTFKRNKIEGPYGERETYGDVRDEKIIDDILKELKPYKDGHNGTEAYGQSFKKHLDLYVDLKDVKDYISDQKRYMKNHPGEADECMNNIREMRAEAIKQINNYRKDE